MGCSLDIYTPALDDPASECPDPMALNFNYRDCYEDEDYNPSDCPWETNDDCEYCEDVYETESERYANCCNIPTAENFATGLYSQVDNPVEWWDAVFNNTSSDSTYCIFD